MSPADPHEPDLTDDDVLLAELAHSFDVHEPVPEDALRAATAAFDLGRVDDELAELVFDSLRDEPLVAMRSTAAAEARSMGFVAHGHRIDVELLESDGLLLGQIEPAADAIVELEAATSATASAPTDARGRFRFDVPRGSFRLRVTTTDGVVICTPWITW